MNFTGKIYQEISSHQFFLAIKEHEPDQCIELLALTSTGGTLEALGDFDDFKKRLDFKKRRYVKKEFLSEPKGEVPMGIFDRVLKELIKEEVVHYYDLIHKPKSAQDFVPGVSKINYSGRVYNSEEMVNLIDSGLEFFLTSSRYDREFCRLFSQFLNSYQLPKVKTLTVNSGSSANLLALTALTSYKLGEEGLKPGDEVITVAASFPTTVAPIIQNQLVPVFVDIQPSTYNIDPTQIEESITEKTKAIFVAHTLGIPFDMDSVLALAEKYHLWVIEDNCDALGAKYELKRKYHLIRGKTVEGVGLTGTFGHVATTSFYPAHQITMGEGGAVYTSDNLIYQILTSLRDWGRDCWCLPGKDNTCGKRFQWQLGHLPEGYDHKYTYSHLGYNLKITDMQAAVGVAQLKKIHHFAETRAKNWAFLKEKLASLNDFLILPSCPEKSTPSPFGFAVTLKEGFGLSRPEICDQLEKLGIQTRTVFGGNLLRQPAFTNKKIPLRVRNSKLLYSDEMEKTHFSLLPVTEKLVNDTFWVGVYPGLKSEMLSFMVESIMTTVRNMSRL